MRDKQRFIKSLLLIMCTSFVISGCASENSNSENQSTKDNTTEMVSDTSENQNEEESLSEAELLRLDSENESIFYLMSQYRLEDSEGEEVNVILFDELVQNFKDIEEDNLFAKKIVEKSLTVDYAGMTLDEKIAFDTYLGLLFQDKVIEDNLPIGTIEEAWSGEGSATDKSGNEYKSYYYLFKFSEYNSVDTSRFSKYLFLLYYDMGWGTYTALKDPNIRLDKAVADFRNSLWITIFHGSVYVEPIDVSVLNAAIDSNREFIDFMVTYRDNAYAPVRVAQLEAEEARKEAQAAEDEYWENKIPSIGMTAEEVKKTSWGSPDKINKDTYAWGTTEQWVYRGKGYVYFRDGVVTSVSER